MINSQNFDKSMTTAYNNVFMDNIIVSKEEVRIEVCVYNYENFLSFNNTVNLEFFVVNFYHKQHEQ